MNIADLASKTKKELYNLFEKESETLLQLGHEKIPDISKIKAKIADIGEILDMIKTKEVK